MYVERMIAEVPHAKKYRKRHLESVDQLLRLIDEVHQPGARSTATRPRRVPLSAVLDWYDGDAGRVRRFYRDPPINAMFRKILRPGATS